MEDSAEQKLHQIVNEAVSENPVEEQKIEEECDNEDEEMTDILEKETDPEKRKRIQQIVAAIKALQAIRKKKEDSIPGEILPYLFLGSIGAAMSKEVLSNLGITHILTCASGIKPMFPDEF